MSSRVLPGGGATQNSNFRDSSKTVDKPNINSKFARKSPSRVNNSTVFDTEVVAPTIRPLRRSVSPMEDSERHYRKEGVRISGHEQRVSDRAKFLEDHPRLVRKSVERAPSPSSAPGDKAVDPVITANGILFPKGRVTSKAKFATTADLPAPPPKPYDSMSRFHHSPRITPHPFNVLIPATCTHSHDGFTPKVQRFWSTPRSPSPTLVGIFSPDPRARQPPPYTPRAPYHTD